MQNKPFKLSFNFHTHTQRCGHAFGGDEEYVIAAIEKGIHNLGFSDHIFYPNLEQPGIRQTQDDFLDYVSSIKALKEKYKDVINIYIGYESEYIPQFKDFYLKMFNNPDIDYMILGQHCFYDKDFEWYRQEPYDPKYVKMYVDNVIEGVKLGIYSYIAHPDLIINAHREKDDYMVEQLTRLCDVSLELDIPLEINLCGSRIELKKKEKLGDPTATDLFYPYDWFWDIVGKKGCKVVVGIDAHSPDEIRNSNLIRAIELMNRYNLNVIDTDFMLSRLKKK